MLDQVRPRFGGLVFLRATGKAAAAVEVEIGGCVCARAPTDRLLIRFKLRSLQSSDSSPYHSTTPRKLV